jgi:hypothetical protein
MPGVQAKLGDLLVQAGLIDEMQLKSALGYQRRWGGKIGKCLVDQGFIEEEKMLRFLSQHFKLGAVDLTRSRIAPQTFAMVPEPVARKYEVVPVVVRDTPGKKTLVLAMSDPSDLQSADEIQFLTNCKIEPVLATDSAIAKVLSHYGDYSPEMASGSQWGASATPAELRRQDQVRVKGKAAATAEPQVVGEGMFDLSEEALDSEGVGIQPDDDEVEIVRDEVTMIRAGMEAPPPRPAPPAATPPLGARVPPPARPTPPPPPKPPAFEEPPQPEAEPEFEIERGAPPVPIAPEPGPTPPGELDLELPKDDGSQMELAGAHEFVPILDQEQMSQAGVGIEIARTDLDRSLFERPEVARADSGLARPSPDESVTEVPRLEDDFFHPPIPKAEPAAAAPEPEPPRPETGPPSLDLPDLDLPPLEPRGTPAAASPPLGARVTSPAAPPPLGARVTSPAAPPPPLDLAESPAEGSLPPVLEPHAPPMPEFDLPPVTIEYEFKPEVRLPFEEPPAKPAFEGDLAERPDTPDFSALAEKPLPKADLTEDEMFFNVEREKPAEPGIETGEMEQIPAAPEASDKLEQAKRKLAELEAMDADFLDANALKARLAQIEELRSEIHTREYQFDELLGLMMKKEMGELTSELFMKELTLLKRRVEESRKKKPK